MKTVWDEIAEEESITGIVKVLLEGQRYADKQVTSPKPEVARAACDCLRCARTMLNGLLERLGEAA